MRSLKDTFEIFRSVGVVNSGREFGPLMGRGASYLSSSVARDRRPSTESLLAMIANVSEIIQATNEEASRCDDKHQRDEFLEGASLLKNLQTETWEEIWGRVAARP